MEPLRFSRLKLMARSPAHARYALDRDAEGDPFWDDSPARRFGRLAHAAVLGQPLPIVYPGPTRRGKEWEAFKAANADKEIVKQSELDTVTAMATALATHAEASRVLQGQREQTVLFDFAGRNCRATPDAFEPGHHMTDLKTTGDANPRWFPYEALRYAYHAQLAFYKDGVEMAGLKPPKDLFIVAVEVKPPHGVCVFGLTPRAEDFGRRLYRTWIEEFLSCERSESWPGYPLGVIDAPEESFELVDGEGSALEAAEDEPGFAPLDGLEQTDLPLVGVAPKGVMRSELSESEAAELRRVREKRSGA